MTTIKTENFTVDISNKENSDDARLFIKVEGLGFVTIVKTHEGLIIDIHNQTESDSITSIGLENNDFMTSGELDDSSSRTDIDSTYPIDLNLLVGIKGECKEFHEEIRNLEAPYLKISYSQFKHLEDQSFDYYMLGDSVFTFGNADGGYALMPVNEERKQELLSLN